MLRADAERPLARLGRGGLVDLDDWPASRSPLGHGHLGGLLHHPQLPNRLRAHASSLGAGRQPGKAARPRLALGRPSSFAPIRRRGFPKLRLIAFESIAQQRRGRLLESSIDDAQHELSRALAHGVVLGRLRRFARVFVTLADGCGHPRSRGDGFGGATEGRAGVDLRGEAAAVRAVCGGRGSATAKSIADGASDAGFRARQILVCERAPGRRFASHESGIEGMPGDSVARARAG